jgi:hypothetical protein
MDEANTERPLGILRVCILHVTLDTLHPIGFSNCGVTKPRPPEPTSVYKFTLLMGHTQCKPIYLPAPKWHDKQ